ncbi:hypothetical protein MHBO_003559 [Bonamia ostreae]|uniref:Uncharacterized protein n=1 Tax=Bonamia ostreae TaxID=126728 RepID=A0ABV2ARL1_9EUKA
MAAYANQMAAYGYQNFNVPIQNQQNLYANYGFGQNGQIQQMMQNRAPHPPPPQQPPKK